MDVCIIGKPNPGASTLAAPTSVMSYDIGSDRILKLVLNQQTSLYTQTVYEQSVLVTTHQVDLFALLYLRLWYMMLHGLDMTDCISTST